MGDQARERGVEMITAKLVYKGGFTFVEFTNGNNTETVRLYHALSYESQLIALGKEFVYREFPISAPTLYELVQVPMEIAGEDVG